VADRAPGPPSGAGIDFEGLAALDALCHGPDRLDRGTPIKLVRNLGHASVATTGKYLHVRPKTAPASFWRFE